MISTGSLAAFSTPVTSRPPSASPAGVVPVREQIPAVQARTLPGAKPPGPPPEAGQKLPRGSLLDLQI